MASHNTWLLDYKSDVYTKHGEDGIIRKILETFPDNDKWCVEFGAWDGRYLSNSRNLIENLGYSAVLIEGDKKKFADLQKNYSANERIIPINQLVGFSDQDNLDHILVRTPVPKTFDFLCIDIDGNDYHAWNAMSEYRPKLVCIEYNPTIPTEVAFVQEADPSTHHGSSLLSLVELGKRKGYELVAILPVNAFFVRSDLYPLFGIADNSVATLRQNLECITYFFVGYDGKIFLRGRRRLQWHGLELREDKIQQLPAFLRTFIGDYSRTQSALLLLYSDPRTFAKRVLHRLTPPFLRR